MTSLRHRHPESQVGRQPDGYGLR